MGAFVPPIGATGFAFLDAALSNYMKAFRNNTLIADMVAPRVPVDKQSGKYWVFGREHQNLLQQTLRATGDPAQRIRRTVSNSSFFCDSHALEGLLPDEDRANFQAGDAGMLMTKTLTDKILLDRENRLATTMTDTAKLTNNTTLAGSSQWSDFGNSTPITNVETAKAQIRQAGVNANYMIIGDQVFQQLIVHPSIVGRYTAIRPGAITAAQLAEVFGIPNVYVASAVSLDKADAVSFVWGKNAIVGYADPNAGPEDLSGMKTFVWRNGPQTIDGYGVVTSRDPRVSAKSDIYAADFYYDHEVTAVETLYLIKNAVA